MPGRDVSDALVDAHCHIDLYERPIEVIKEAEDHHVYTIAVTNVPSVFPHTTQLVSRSPFVRPALGLHPELVKSHGHELSRFNDYLGQTRYVGEVGLDYTTTDQAERQAQRKVFETILTWCGDDGYKVLTVHSRRASKDVLARIGKAFPGTIILHWFSGSEKEVDAAVDAGMFFSINNAMLRTQRGEALIRRMPLERVITESDGPFIKSGFRPDRPTDIAALLPGLSAIWGIDHAATRSTILSTFRRMLTESAAR